MELRHVRYFLAVAEELNFSRAAARIRVAQPALSRQIHDLEDELGFKLFERSTTRVDLTPAGEFFRQQAGKLLMQLDIAVTGAQRIAHGTTSVLRIGTAWNVGAAELFVTEAANELRERHPQLSIEFVELPFHEHVAAIRDRRIDVGFVGREWLSSRKDISFRLIYSGAMKAVLPGSHPLAGRAAVGLRELKEERWLTLVDDEVPGFRALLTRVLRPAQFTPRFGPSARSIHGILALVSSGGGIALVPELILPVEPTGLRYLATDSAPYEQFAVWRNDPPVPEISAYLEILLGRIQASTGLPADRKPGRRQAAAGRRANSELKSSRHRPAKLQPSAVTGAQPARA
jgi:DNA-binding transcriptional LysR family regulator